MKRPLSAVTLLIFAVVPAAAGELKVTGVKAEHRNGQTFVTWKDVAEGEAGAKYRYSVYRSAKPITDPAGAELCMSGVFHNSAKLFGSAFWAKDRLDPTKPTCIIVEGGEPLPNWSGVAVLTIEKSGKSHYAVVATEGDKPVTAIVPGESATAAAVEEKPAPIQPIKIYDSKERKTYVAQTCISGKQGLPLHVSLHASSGRGGGASGWGDYYLYFSRPEWGYRDGLPGIFSVQERRDGTNRLVLDSRDAIVTPDGTRAMETYWFGYVCVPQRAEHTEPRAYNFTERRMLWVVDWAIKRYGADPERVYAGGGSMGAWGSMTFAIRHPEVFAAIYPNRPRTRQRGMPSVVKIAGKKEDVKMYDGQTTYIERMDMVKFVENHPADLPFVGWCCGRRDGFASWQEQIDMVNALTKAKHGFAFAWNDGDHSSGSYAMGQVTKYHGADKFARNASYPAFGNSSINGNMGGGDPKDGDLGNADKRQGPIQVFGINLGFAWSDVVDEAGRWSAKISNELCKADMTVDVTPRRCRQFEPKPGESFKWTASSGGSGTVAADANGLVTVEKLVIKPGAQTSLTISR